MREPAAREAQALRGVGLVDAEPERKGARGVDVDARAVGLQVERAGVLAVVGPELADHAERRLGLQRVGHQHAQEQPVARGEVAQPGAQVLGEAGIARERPEVEEDVGAEQRLRRRLADPGREPLAPFRRLEAVLGVARHDVAGAQREAEFRQAVVGRARELEQLAAHALELRRRAVEQDGVVLVGHHGLLAPPFAADRQPAPLDLVELVLRQQQVEQAVRQRVVQRGDGVRERLGGRALCHQVVGQRLDVGDDALQPVHVARKARRLQDVAHGDALQREQVALRHHAHQPPLPRHHQLVESELRHLRERLLRGGHLVDGARTVRHHRRDRRREVDALEHDPVQQVGLGEDADRPLRRVDHGDAADALAAHRLEGGADRRTGLAEHRVAPHHVAQRLEQRALLDRPLAEVLAQLPERVLHDARRAPARRTPRTAGEACRSASKSPRGSR